MLLVHELLLLLGALVMSLLHNLLRNLLV